MDPVIDSVIRDLRAAKDQAYAERNKCVAALAGMALRLGFNAYLGRHDEADAAWERDWMNIVFIDLPTGQVSWHLHDTELPLFTFLPVGGKGWDGHSTEEKYERLQRFSSMRPIESVPDDQSDGRPPSKREVAGSNPVGDTMRPTEPGDE